MNKKRLTINILSNCISFFITFGISFFLTPYITEHLSSEAYGFISLGNNFVGYATIITIAINSMAARFITIKLCENKENEANEYFSSVAIANTLIALVLIIPAALLIIYIDRLLNISTGIVTDVKVLWLFLFASFLIDIIMSVFGVAIFAKNRLDLSAKRDIVINVIKAIIVFSLFLFFTPHVWYYGLAIFISGILLVLININYTKKLIPALQFSRSKFSIASVKILLSSGIWNSLSSLSSVLLEGLDLLIADIFIGSVEMGILAIAKMIPGAINSMVSVLESVFVPEFTILYASGKKDELLKEVTTSIKIMNVFSVLPIMILLVFGRNFFKLWVPKQNAELLQILSILTVGVLFFTSTIKPLYAIFTVTNKVKANSIALLINGVLSTATVFLLLKILPSSMIRNGDMPWGLYIIAGVSTIYGIIRALTFTPIYAAHCLNIKWNSFYKVILRSTLSIIIACVVALLIKSAVKVDSWMTLILSCLVCVLIVFPLTVFVILTRTERKIFFGKFLLIIYKGRVNK